MADYERKYMDALRNFERGCKVWMSEQYAKIVESKRDQFADQINACYRDTGHHAACGTFDPDDGECDCGFEIGLRF